MLSFDIQSLESTAAQVDGQLAADDPVWEEGDLRPAGPIRVYGRLSAAGPGRFYFSGRVEGTAQSECRRCLTDTSSEIAVESHLIFAAAEHDDENDDADVYVLDRGARSLDLRPAVREEWVLNAPAFAVCREDCKGFCGRCGADLNDGDCACPPATDARWGALRDARLAD